MDQLRSLIARRAARAYRDEEIPLNLVRQLVDQARWTGSARNRQPWRFVAAYDAATRIALSKLGTYAAHVAEAPVALVLLSPTVRNLDTEFDLGRIAQSLTLAATAAGIGSCVISLYPEENARRAAALVETDPAWRARHVMALGYPSAEISTVGPARLAIPSGRHAVDDLLRVH